MSYHANIFSQILQHLSKLEFQGIVDKYNGDYRVRAFDCWTWFGALIYGQLTGHNSVRKISRLSQVNSRHLKTLGFNVVHRSTFAEANERRPLAILEDTYYRILAKVNRIAPKSKFRFKGQILAIDSTVISTCLSLCPWATFHHSNGAFKLHTAIDIAGDLPQFAVVTPGLIHDITVAKSLEFSTGSTLIMDKAYIDYAFLRRLTYKGVWFVVRMKKNCQHKVKRCRKTNRTQGIICDQTIRFSSPFREKHYPMDLRKVSYKDLQTGNRYTFLSNRFDLSAQTIADLYKSRWQVELFFKTLKNQLRIKKLLGTSIHSVKAQIWAALIAYLLVWFVRCQNKLKWSIPEVMAVLGCSILARSCLSCLLKEAPSYRLFKPPPDQLQLFTF